MYYILTILLILLLFTGIIVRIIYKKIFCDFASIFYDYGHYTIIIFYFKIQKKWRLILNSSSNWWMLFGHKFIISSIFQLEEYIIEYRNRRIHTTTCNIQVTKTFLMFIHKETLSLMRLTNVTKIIFKKYNKVYRYIMWMNHWRFYIPWIARYKKINHCNSFHVCFRLKEY